MLAVHGQKSCDLLGHVMDVFTLCLSCARCRDGSTVLQMVCTSTMCNRSSQRSNMAKVIVDAGVDRLAKDKVRGR